MSKRPSARNKAKTSPAPYDNPEAWPVPQTEADIPSSWSARNQILALRGVGRRLQHLRQTEKLYDETTGALKESAFKARIEADRIRHPDAARGIIYIDGGNFKRVNVVEADGSGGKQRGDDVLRMMVAFFGRFGDTVARLGGDELAVYIDASSRDGNRTPQQVLEDQIVRIESGREPIVAKYPELDEGSVRFYVSAGGALFSPGVPYEAALHVANIAEDARKPYFHEIYGAYRVAGE